MTNQHPITPPPSLIDQWWKKAKQNAKYDEPIGPLVATQAAQWGSDQELEACVKWIEDCGYHPSVPEDLRAARRPKPTSLKEQALEALQFVDEKLKGHLPLHSHCNAIHTISRALEQLND